MESEAVRIPARLAGRENDLLASAHSQYFMRLNHLALGKPPRRRDQV